MLKRIVAKSVLILVLLFGGVWASAASYSGIFDEAVPEANAEGVSSTIIIADDVLIDSITIAVSMDHPWIGDLSMVLTAPDGTELYLLDRPGLPPGVGIGFCCGSGATITSITFDDAALLAAEDIVSTLDFDRVASPTDALSSLLTTSTVGAWTLTISDFAQGQQNRIAPLWTINVNESVTPVPLPAAVWLLLSGVSWLGLMRKRSTSRIFR